MFIGPAAVAPWVRQNRVSPSFPLFGCFLGIRSSVFSKFRHGARNPNHVLRDRIRFFRETSFAQNTGKMGQNWALNWVFINLFKKLLNFYWMCSIMKIYIICCVSVLNLFLVKILYLRHGPKCSLPIRLQYFQKNEISRTNQWNGLNLRMLIPIQKN